MITDYFQHSLPKINNVLLSQEQKIQQAVDQMVKAIKDDGIIYGFGTGHSHMLPMEMFGRAGGLANVCAMLDESVLNGGGARRSSKMEQLPGLADIIWESTPPTPKDMIFIVSNSGRNAAIVEMALRAKNEGVFTVAITSLTQSRANASRHASGKKLYEIADIVLDNGAPDGDAQIQYGNYTTGPLSSLTGIVLVNSMICEAVRICEQQKISVPLFQSQNTERKTNNDELFTRYVTRIPRF
ncbi:SIS domain-containing protein [Klebsiella grimontii]|uniref:SIS domain-containing protein n=1 Tax=Klebsiella grimontii TaxID=2058152 RepID=UPI00300C7377